ncbi:hypothetical protein CYMTET_35748 [Cymbomonas tetramitiformis]|uniref:Uncharacterized protein n=1 Tax=Cymbomonas tetramitiformis TaxID=36881 RepID=A0AAE0F8K8_9CHLO|nr:hypothetical protein CYMTET_35748 [Cymbomonas tetramitiformis]
MTALYAWCAVSLMTLCSVPLCGALWDWQSFRGYQRSMETDDERGQPSVELPSSTVPEKRLHPRLSAKVDWASFLGKHDLLWNFTGTDEELPSKWTEAPFFGNGFLGGSIRVLQEKGKLKIRFHVGRGDIWDKRAGKSKLSQKNNFQYDRPRLPVGYFDLILKGSTVVSGEISLSLYDAVVTGVVKTDVTEVQFEAYAPTTPGVLVVQLKRQHPAEWDADPPAWQWVPEISAAPSWHLGFAKEGTVEIPKGWEKAKGGYKPNPYPPERREAAGGISVSEQTLLAGAEAASRAVQSALVEDSEALKERHKQWWHQFYGEGALLSIPETWMEGFYYIQMYKLGSMMRSGGPIVDLNGPWLFTPTSWADLHWDLNVQLTYLPILTANRLELGEPLLRFFNSSAVRASLRENVPKAHRKGSMALPSSGSSDDALSSCYWSFAKGDCTVQPGGHKGAIIGNLLWMCHVMFLQYRYSMDESILFTVLYPVLHEAAAHHITLLKKDRTGRLSLPVAASPEYKTNGPNTNYDLALLRWGLQTLLWVGTEVAERQHQGLSGLPVLEPVPAMEKWRKTLDKLHYYPRDGATGYNIAEGVPLQVGQRHFSHLLMFYPLALETWEDLEARPLLEKSVDHWARLCKLDRDGSPESCAGYSLTGAASFSSLMNRADAALGNITNLLHLTPRWYKQQGKKLVGMGATLGENTFYGERCKKVWSQPCPCMETPLHAADALQGMLLQSGAGVVDVFPAVPSAWKQASFHRLRAEGAFLVSARWTGGNTEVVGVESLFGGTCIVRTRILGEVEAYPSNVTVKEVKQGVHSVDLPRGTMVLLFQVGALKRGDSFFDISPVVSIKEQEHYWGKH